MTEKIIVAEISQFKEAQEISSTEILRRPTSMFNYQILRTTGEGEMLKTIRENNTLNKSQGIQGDDKTEANKLWNNNMTELPLQSSGSGKTLFKVGMKCCLCRHRKSVIIHYQ